jgi:hypothetical protein
MIRTVGGERDGRQGGRRGTTSETASKAFDVVVMGLVLSVVRPVLAAVPPRDFGALVAALLRYVNDPMFRQEQIGAALHDDDHPLMRGMA